MLKILNQICRKKVPERNFVVTCTLHVHCIFSCYGIHALFILSWYVCNNNHIWFGRNECTCNECAECNTFKGQSWYSLQSTYNNVSWKPLWSRNNPIIALIGNYCVRLTRLVGESEARMGGGEICRSCMLMTRTTRWILGFIVSFEKGRSLCSKTDATYKLYLHVQDLKIWLTTQRTRKVHVVSYYITCSLITKKMMQTKGKNVG